jgi:hypothetical protein
MSNLNESAEENPSLEDAPPSLPPSPPAAAAAPVITARRWPANADLRRGLAILGALALFALWRALQLRLLGSGIGNDVQLYRRYAQAWGGGAVPYVGFQPEYPPGALPFFLIPHLFVGSSGDYPLAFGIEMGCFDLLAYLLVLQWGRWLRPERLRMAAAMGLAYLVVTAALYPILYTRFDIVPGAMVLVALTLAYAPARRPGTWFGSAVVLGIAGAVKLWPLALAPTWLLLGWRRDRWRGFFAGGIGFGLGVAVVFAPLLPVAGKDVLRFLDYHAARGIEIGSTWASVALLLNLGHIYDAWTAHDFGAFHVKGPAAEAYARWSMYLLPIGVLVPQLGGFFGGLGRDEDGSGEVGLRVTLATVLGFMVFGKVLSPQFALWLVPLLPLVCRNVGLALVAVGIAVGTTIEYPFVAAALEMLKPGHAQAVFLVAGRNALLVLLFVILCLQVGWSDAIRCGWRRVIGGLRLRRAPAAQSAPSGEPTA